MNFAIRRRPQPSCWAAVIPAVNATVVTASSAARGSITSRSPDRRGRLDQLAAEPLDTPVSVNGCDSNPGFLLHSYSNASLSLEQGEAAPGPARAAESAAWRRPSSSWRRATTGHRICRMP